MAQSGGDQDDQDSDESGNDGPDQPRVTSCPSVVLGPAIRPGAVTRSPTAHDFEPYARSRRVSDLERTTGPPILPNADLDQPGCATNPEALTLPSALHHARVRGQGSARSSLERAEDGCSLR